MKTLNDIRKALKPLGYNVKTKTYSFGRHMSFINNLCKDMDGLLWNYARKLTDEELGK